jgi:hypothetical protein
MRRDKCGTVHLVECGMEKLQIIVVDKSRIGCNALNG